MTDITYGKLLADLVNDIARYADREKIFRRNDISKDHFYNVTNPNRKSSGKKRRRYHCPTEWGVKLTRDSQNYSWLKRVADDCDCICLTPDDIDELKGTDTAQALAVFQKILGMVRD